MKKSVVNYTKVLSAISLILAFTFKNYQAKAQPTLSLTAVISTGLSEPTQLCHAGDGTNRIFIVQKGGTIRLYDQNYNFLSTFLTVPNISTTGEQGLLSLAFHPDYKTNGFFFVYYVNAGGDLEIARYKVSANAALADAASKVVILTIPHPTNENHNGGELHFGNDGYLYLSTGDGGGGGDAPNNAQNTSVLLGKMLRLAVNTSLAPPYYSIPASNPYGNEIYAIGLRNPFRWSFDRQTQDMWIGDVGQNLYEEIDYRPAASSLGANYGWRCYEGNNAYNTTGCGAASNYIFPVYAYVRPNVSASIIGGCVYRGNTYLSLQGYYVSADFYSGNFYLIVPNGTGGWTTTIQTALKAYIADFGETENGELFAVSLSENKVYRVVSDGLLPLTLLEFKAQSKKQTIVLNWQTSSETNLMQFDIEYSTNGLQFTKAGTVKAQNKPQGAHYNFEQARPLQLDNTLFYRLKMVDTDGNFTYSKTVTVLLDKTEKGNFINLSIINSPIITLTLTESFNSIEIINMNGSLVFEQNIAHKIGSMDISIKNITTGIYIVRLKGQEKNISQKIIIP